MAAGAHCLVGGQAVAAWYASQVASGVITADPLQARVVDRLQTLADDLAAQDDGAQGSWFARLRGKRPAAVPGVYIHGGVGRGKSFLMDGFFLNLPLVAKLRVHYHGFMRHFHEDMQRLADAGDSLQAVADRLAERCRLLCIDEFHVSDITDAMVLGRMLEVLAGRGVTLVATSNYPPAGLYPNGLGRDRFLPAIALLERQCDVIGLDGDTDYRLRALRRHRMYLCPDGAATAAEMQERFASLANGLDLTPSVRVGANRRMAARRRSSDALWLDFDVACGGNHGQADYLMLAERFTSVFLSGVPQLETGANPEATRRFTWLVDVFYDCRVKLVIQASVPLEGLFAGGGGESGRTRSRLEEMQAEEYLAQAVVTLPGSRPPSAPAGPTAQAAD